MQSKSRNGPPELTEIARRVQRAAERQAVKLFIAAVGASWLLTFAVIWVRSL